MTVSAIVPQKQLGEAKSRLRGALAPGDRATLSLALLRHVCGTVAAVVGVDRVTVVTPDPGIRQYLRGWGLGSVLDPGRDLNDALARVMASPVCEGRDALVVVADLPWLRPPDVVALLAASRRRSVVLAPSKDGAGTSALLVPAGVRFTPAFGIGSRVAHRRAAQASGLGVVEIVRPGTAFDLDTPEDLGGLSALAWLEGYLRR